MVSSSPISDPDKPRILSDVPIKLQNGQLARFVSFANLSDPKEHVAIVFGDIESLKSPLVRVHSECLTGDVFGSRRCDCGFQLSEAIERLSLKGGVLLYLRQEGRGIGLYEKLAAYDLQIHQNMDTYKANLALGHTEDSRDFKVASEMLAALNLNKISLLSNNPDKQYQLEAFGVYVTKRFPTSVHIHEDNKSYLEAKANENRHVFDHHPRDIFFMTKALDQAKLGLGRTAPNPSVGCVIVKDNEIIASARTADSGRPHAESLALESAGHKAKDAEMFVTLEPCNHHGVTSPCVDAIIKAGVQRVVIACSDPHASTNGQSIKKLQSAGIEVLTGVLQSQAQKINQGFFLSLNEKRPLITLKIATSLDGKIATGNGHSKWITGEVSRKRVHLLRALHDGIMVGSETYLKDNPSLNVRDVDYDGPTKKRIVIDRQGRLADEDNLIILRHQNIEENLNELVDLGLTRVLVEGGGKLISSLIKHGLWDELYWFKAPIIIGNEGVPAFDNFDLSHIEGAMSLSLGSFERLGKDSLEVWRRDK